jgi:putative PIG3 family NAD(P)H quinone oxidoreductase
MYAIVITKPGGPEVLRIQEVEDLTPGPEELLVDVKAAAVNRGDERRREAGSYDPPIGTQKDILGLEIAGVVREVGIRVPKNMSGERIFALLPGGGYAQRVVIHHRMAMTIPANLDFIQAASIPEVFFTAFDALFNRCRLTMGERVLIHAVGSGVGSAALQLAHNAGAFTFGTARSKEKLTKAFALGLDIGINYHEDDCPRVIEKHTEGHGVDVIFDLVGATYWQSNLASLAPQGRIALVASLGGKEETVNLGLMQSKRASIYGTILRTRSLEEKILLTEQFCNQILPLFASGSLKPVVDRVFPLEKVVEAHQYLESNANFGKVVMTVP